MKGQFPAASRNALRAASILLVFSLVATALLSLTFTRTQPTIEKSEQAKRLALLNQVLPPTLYDNDLLASRQTLPADERLGTQRPSSMWVARRGGEVTAVVVEVIAPDGYSGAIHLLVGIGADGRVTGVRVTAHRETPGLGDYIDRAKSAWIEQFTGKDLLDPEPRLWKVAKDGGVFDARAGATITPRAVVKAVRLALEYFAQHRAAIVAPIPAQAPVKENAP